MANYPDTDTWGIDTRKNLSTSGEESSQFDGADSIFQAILDGSPNAGYVNVYRDGILLAEQTQVLINSSQTSKGNVKNASYLDNDNKLRIGDIIDWRGDKFLCFGWENKEVQEFHESVMIHLCNKDLRYRTTTRVSTGETGLYGEPIYEDTYTENTISCVYDAKKLDHDDEQLVNLPNDKLIVEVQYNDKYAVDMRITIDNKPYRIYGIDFSYTKTVNNSTYGVLLLDLKIEK